jgi:amino acid permease
MSYLVLSVVIELIPKAAADAVLIFVGLEGIFVTTLWKRMYVLVTSDDDCGLDVDPNAARRFVLLQLLVLAAGWALNVSPAGLAFPLVIAALVPIRVYLLPRLFTSRQLMILDDEEQHR